MTNRQIQEMKQQKQQRIILLNRVALHLHLAACALKKCNKEQFLKEMEQAKIPGNKVRKELPAPL